jgi:hypothetical protein
VYVLRVTVSVKIASMLAADTLTTDNNNSNIAEADGWQSARSKTSKRARTEDANIDDSDGVNYVSRAHTSASSSMAA